MEGLRVRALPHLRVPRETVRLARETQAVSFRRISMTSASDPGLISIPSNYSVDETLARAAMERAIQKLPIKARFVIRPGTHGTPEVQV